MTKAIKIKSASGFDESLLQSLKLLKQPEKLGIESPLASPYFLSRAMQPEINQTSPEVRGQLLKKLIRKAAQQLWGDSLPKDKAEMQALLQKVRQERDSTQYSYLVLELRYFQDYFQPRSLRQIYEDDAYLLDSKTGDHRAHKLALQRLGEMLLSQVRPVLRLEQPVTPDLFVGYRPEQQKLAEVLQHNQTVFLSGAGGVGKTSLAARTVQKMQDKAIFWYTFHPTLNDRLSSLLFGLGHFLHEQGASQLWQYLLAKQGALTDFNVSLGFVRQDIASLQNNPPIFCFDELERIYHTDPGQIEPTHRQLLEFLECLRGTAPILLISQRPFLDSDSYITLSGLERAQILALWQEDGYSSNQPPNPTEIEKLYQATQGNLRLLRICYTLHQDGVAMDEIIPYLSSKTGLYPIFQRLWRRLQEDERHLMQKLSVFRGPAPEHLWEQQTVTALRMRHLLEKDGQGGVVIVATLHELIYSDLAPEQREALHLQAAEALLSYAEYTEVAYHFWQAGHPNQAIQVWYPQRQSEIQRGHTDAALAIFDQISRNQVDQQEQRGLDLVRAELRQMRGELTKGMAEMAEVTWHDASESRARFLALQGTYQDALGYPDQAIRSYDEGVQLLTRLQIDASRFHHRLGMLHVRQRELSTAKREAHLLECQMHNLFGEIDEEGGSYNNALLSYQKALVVAQSLNDGASIAKTSRNLANLLGGRLQRLDEALIYAQQAISYYEQIGDRLTLEYTRSNLAYIYIQNRQFQAALALADQAYRFFKTIQYSYHAAVEAVNLAEAYFELGNLEQAEHYALEALDIEERHTTPFAFYNLGRVERQRGNVATAKSYLTQSMRTAEMNEDPYMHAYALRELGKVFLQTEDKNEGQQIVTQALQIFQQLGMINEVQETEKILNESTEKLDQDGAAWVP